MGYVDAFRAIESTFTEAIVLSSGEAVNQSGTYIFFDGSNAKNPVEDELSFTLVVASNTYTGENGAMSEIDKYRKRVLKSPFNIEFKRCSGVSFENSSLYLVAMELSIQINITE